MSENTTGKDPWSKCRDLASAGDDRSVRIAHQLIVLRLKERGISIAGGRVVEALMTIAEHQAIPNALGIYKVIHLRNQIAHPGADSGAAPSAARLKEAVETYFQFSAWLDGDAASPRRKQLQRRRDLRVLPPFNKETIDAVSWFLSAAYRASFDRKEYSAYSLTERDRMADFCANSDIRYVFRNYDNIPAEIPIPERIDKWPFFYQCRRCKREGATSWSSLESHYDAVVPEECECGARFVALDVHPARKAIQQWYRQHREVALGVL